MYTVQILQGANAYDSFVYQIQNPAFLHSGQPSSITTSSTREQTTSWTDFSANAPVIVQVTNKKPFLSVRILPTSANIVPAVHGNVVTFPMSSTGQRQVSVDFCYSSSVCNDTTDTDVTDPTLDLRRSLAQPPRPRRVDRQAGHNRSVPRR